MNKKLTPWIGIARVGTFTDSAGRKHTFKEEDLESIRTAYDPARSEAPLVFGHPKDDAPAYGWVESLKREGGKLFARFAHVPEKIRNLVENKHYRYLSMSLGSDKKRLLHVGLLGAVPPAIDGLGPVNLNDGDVITIDFSKGESMSGDGDLQKQIGALNEQIKSLKAENEQLKAKLAETEKGKSEAEKGKDESDKKARESAAEFAAYKEKVVAEKREDRLDGLIYCGKVEPGEKKSELRILNSLAKDQDPVSFSSADGKVEEISAEEAYFRSLEARKVTPLFSNFSNYQPPKHVQEDSFAEDWRPEDVTNKL